MYLTIELYIYLQSKIMLGIRLFCKQIANKS